MPRLKILVVDDIAEITEFLKEMLEPDHEVHTENDALEAKRLCESRRFDLVITDYSMPHLNGLGLMQAVLRTSPGTRFAFLTGFTDPESLARSSPPEVLILQKPLRWSRLKEMLETMPGTEPCPC